MEQHPVPQHIAAFEFKLFGNLTVRQFVTLAIPLSLAALVFFSGLPPVIRLPLSGAVALFAFFVALVPIQGRSFDKWAVAFIRAILSPTQRVWIKEAKLPEFLNVVVNSPPKEETIPEAITAQGRQRLLMYLRSLPKGTITPIDVKEQIAIQRLNLEVLPSAFGQAYGGKLPPPIILPTTKIIQSSLPQVTSAPALSMAQTTDEPSYGAIVESLPPTTSKGVSTIPKIAPHAKAYALPGLEKKLQGETESIELISYLTGPTTTQAKTPRRLASDINFSQELVIPIKTPDNKLKLVAGVGKTKVRKLHFAPPLGFDLSQLPIRGERKFEISEELKKLFHPYISNTTEPQVASTTLHPPDKIPQTKMGAAQPLPKAKTAPIRHHLIPNEEKRTTTFRSWRSIPKTKLNLETPKDIALKQLSAEAVDSKISVTSQKSPKIPLPATNLTPAQMVPLTNKPNVLSGQITMADGAPIEGAILIVRDENGIPLRALKTNKLGQFLSATSLANGKYSVETESAAANFDPFTINLESQVLAPLQIKARAT